MSVLAEHVPIVRLTILLQGYSVIFFAGYSTRFIGTLFYNIHSTLLIRTKHRNTCGRHITSNTRRNIDLKEFESISAYFDCFSAYNCCTYSSPGPRDVRTQIHLCQSSSFSIQSSSSFNEVQKISNAKCILVNANPSCLMKHPSFLIHNNAPFRSAFFQISSCKVQHFQQKVPHFYRETRDFQYEIHHFIAQSRTCVASTRFTKLSY